MAGIRIGGPVFTPLNVNESAQTPSAPAAVNNDVSSYDGITHRAAQAVALGSADGSRPAYLNLLPPGWTPNQPIKLDPSRSFDVGYQRMIMAQTAVQSAYQQHTPLPTDAFMKDAYKYWIPKFDTIGGKGLDSYWLGRLLEPPGDGGGGDDTTDMDGFANTTIMDEIMSIITRKEPDHQKTEEIRKLLASKGLPAGAQP